MHNDNQSQSVRKKGVPKHTVLPQNIPSQYMHCLSYKGKQIVRCGVIAAPTGITESIELTCCDGPPTPLTGPASPAGAWAIGAPAGTPLPAALPTPGPPATPARGTLAMPVYNSRQEIRLANVNA